VDCSRCGLGFFDPMVAGDARLYHELQNIPWYYQEVKPEFDFAAKHIQPGDEVLEIGCGSGAFAKCLPSGSAYVGLEFNEMAVEKARAKGLNVRIESIEDHAKSHAGQYGIVCSFQVLEHVPNPRDFLRAARACLKPGGRLIIAVPSEESFLATATNSLFNMPPHHVTRWKDRTLEFAASMASCDLREIWHEPLAVFHREWYERVLIYRMCRILPARTLGDLPRTLFVRAVGKISGYKVIRRALAWLANRSFAHAGRGHTVCLVARAVT